MSVASNENKQMLMDLMKSIGDSNNCIINEPQLSQFVNEKCNYFHTQRFEFSDLNEINKKIVELSYNFIMSNQPRSNIPQQKAPPVSKREMFDVGLATQEAQFKKMINPKKPKEIDFSDGSDDFPVGNLDTIMNQTLADRQKELESIQNKYSTDDKKQAQKWLNREEDSTPKIKIEKTSNLVLDNTIQVKSERKRVTFDINEKTNNENTLQKLFLKLKPKKEMTNNDITEKLTEIISNQEKFLNLFDSIISNQTKITNLLDKGLPGKPVMVPEWLAANPDYGK